MAEKEDNLAPETVNREQVDEGQAQQVGQDAENLRQRDVPGLTGGDKPAAGVSHSVSPQDEQDLVDHMRQMERSGQIDNSAYRGEPMMDDEEDQLGLTDRPDHGRHGR